MKGTVLAGGSNHHQLYVPPGFAHGVQVLPESALFVYICTASYRPETEIASLWSDPSLGIDWPLADPILSEKDREGVLLREVPSERLPAFS